MNRVRELIKADRPALGAWLGLGSAFAAELLAAIPGCEWLCVDAQHGPFGPETIVEIIRAVERWGRVPFVRSGTKDPATLGWYLDADAKGVIVANVETQGEAMAMAKAMRYPPNGCRSFGGARSQVGYDSGNRREDILVIAQIESTTGVKNADFIAQVDGVDAGYLGPADLSLSLGEPKGSQAHEEAILRVLTAFKNAGKPCGIPCHGDANAVATRLRQGFTLVDPVCDIALIKNADALFNR